MKNSPLEKYRLRYEDLPFKLKAEKWPTNRLTALEDQLYGLFCLTTKIVKRSPLARMIIGIVVYVSMIALLFQPGQALAHPTPIKPQYIQPVKPIAQTTAQPIQEIVEVPETYTGTGDYYLDLIVQHESGGNPLIYNSIGACGLFQSLPCSKVLSMCGSLNRVACQIEWGRQYVASVYGSSYNAWVHELNFNWY